MVTILIVTDKGKAYCMSKDIETAETCLKSINSQGKMDVVYINDHEKRTAYLSKAFTMIEGADAE